MVRRPEYCPRATVEVQRPRRRVKDSVLCRTNVFAKRITSVLQVSLVDDCVGEPVEKAVAAMSNGQVCCKQLQSDVCVYVHVCPCFGVHTVSVYVGTVYHATMTWLLYSGDSAGERALLQGRGEERPGIV
eukprot:366229-Chlamydomonas_euryale.AAC.21